jgi:hypothetical protein
MAVAAAANRIPSRTVVLGGTVHDDASRSSTRLLPVLEGALVLPGYRVERLEDVRPENLQTDRWSRREGPVLLVGVVGDSPSLEQEYDRAQAAGGTCLMFALKGRNRSRFEERLTAEAALTAHVDSPEELLQELVRAVRAWEHLTLGGLLLEGPRYRVLHGAPRFDAAPERLESIPLSGEEEVLVFHGPPGPALKRIVLECAASRWALRFLPDDVPIFPELLKPYFANQEALLVEADRRPARELHALVETLGNAPPRNRQEGPRLVLTTRTRHLGALETMLREQNIQGELLLVQALAETGAPRAPTPHDLPRALETLTEPVPGNVLRDLAQAAAEQPGELADVTARVLERITKQYGQLPASRQQEVLDFVGDIASLHPERALDFVTREFEPALLAVSETMQWELSRILASVLGAPACVARACDLLWRMAEPDHSERGQTPLPAEFALRNAGGSGPTRSPASEEAFVAWAEQRAQGIPAERLARYLEPLPGTEPALRRRVTELLHRVSPRRDTTEVPFEHVLVGDFPWDDEGRHLLQEQLDLAARTLLDTSATPEEALARLARSIRALRDAGGLPRVMELFQAVANVSPGVLLHWGQVMMREPTHPLRQDLHGLLSALVDSEPELACVLVDALCEQGDAGLLRGLSFDPGHLEALGEARLVALYERMLTHPEHSVRVAALKRLGDDRGLPERVLARLLLTARRSDLDEPASARAWAQAVDRSRIYDAFRREEKEALVAALRGPRSLGSWSHLLLQRFAATVPAALVDLMLARIEDAAEAGADYEAVPVMRLEQDPPYQQLRPEERQRALAAVERLLEHEHSAVRAQARRWLADLVVVKPPRPRAG